jgi:hypothetical protein
MAYERQEFTTEEIEQAKAAFVSDAAICLMENGFNPAWCEVGDVLWAVGNGFAQGDIPENSAAGHSLLDKLEGRA